MENTQILVVDDDPDVRALVGTILGHEGAQVSLAGDGCHALELLEKRTFQVLFTDLCMPGVDGLTIMRRIPEVCPQLSTVVFTGNTRLDSCVEAMRLGACDYVTKPFTPQAIRHALTRALQASRGKVAPDATRPQVSTELCPANDVDRWPATIVAESPAMREVCQLAARVATTEAAVLIHGEPGVGKELLARTIHRQSRRAAGAFVHVNCGAIREANLESWLFGSRRSHFLSGDQTCWGLLREAHGGTVFLSNVESLPVWAQIQLCDTLQGNGIAGSATSSPTAFDVRRIASVSCNLEEAVAEGRFYGGLYYLLNVVALRIPPLRLRQRDIKILAESYLAQILAKQGAANRRPHHFTEEAWQCLLNYDWPGNLPELANVVARAVALADGPEIGGRAIALAPRKIRDDRSDTISVPFTGSLREIEQCIIEEVIQRCDGNKAAAARALGLHRRTLYRMLEEGAGDEVSREPD